MKVGDLVTYNHAPRDHVNYRMRIKVGLPVDQIGLIISENKEGCGHTLQIMAADKRVEWYVAKCCEVINESRK